MDDSLQLNCKSKPWNKGKLIGQKLSLKQREIGQIRANLEVMPLSSARAQCSGVVETTGGYGERRTGNIVELASGQLVAAFEDEQRSTARHGFGNQSA